jgi:hypothetical protein
VCVIATVALLVLNSAMQFRSTPDSSRASRVRIPIVDIAFGLASNNLLKLVWKTEVRLG